MVLILSTLSEPTVVSKMRVHHGLDPWIIEVLYFSGPCYTSLIAHVTSVQVPIILELHDLNLWLMKVVLHWDFLSRGFVQLDSKWCPPVWYKIIPSLSHKSEDKSEDKCPRLRGPPVGQHSLQHSWHLGYFTAKKDGFGETAAWITLVCL